jgi:hypothetical protein
MKILLKWMLSLIFTLATVFNVQAYNDEDLTNKVVDGSLISNWADSALAFIK